MKDPRPEPPQKETEKKPDNDQSPAPETPDYGDVVKNPGDDNNGGNDPVDETYPGDGGDYVPPPIDCLPPVDIEVPIESPYDDHPPVDCHPPIYIPEIVIVPPVCPPCVATVCQPTVTNNVIVETTVIEETEIIEEEMEEAPVEFADTDIVSVEAEETPEAILTLIVGEAASLEAEGLGNQPGAVAIEVNGIGLRVPVNNWKDDLLEINVPQIGLTESTLAKLYLFDSEMTPLATLDVELIMAAVEVK